MGERIRSRSALIVGLGSLLAIMAVAGLGALRVLENVRNRDEIIRRQFLSRNHVLNDIRSQVYLSGTMVRDYLLEPDPARAEANRTSLENTQRQMDASLESYGREIGPEEAQHYSDLRAELNRYWEGLAARRCSWIARNDGS